MEKESSKLLFPSIAEKLSEKDIINLFVVPPLKFSLIDHSENNIVEGERGTGKTIMLRYVEINKKNDFEDENGNVFPVYIPLSKASFDLMLPYDTLDESRKYPLCLEYFNLYCLSHIVKEIEKSNRFNKLFTKSVQSKIEEKLDFDYPYRKISKSIRKRIDVLIKGFQRNLEVYAINPLAQNTTIINFIENLNSIQETEICFLLLLDDFYKIPFIIQPYIVCQFNQRSPYVTFKIATINKGIEDVCYPTGYFEYMHDYIKYNANRLCAIKITKSFKNIQKYFEEIANRQILRNEKTIIDLLGNSKDLNDIVIEYKKKIQVKNVKARISYFGFENIFAISSGNARVFLNIVKEILREALSQKYDYSQPISQTIQNDKISFVSKQSLASIGAWHREQSIEHKLGEIIPISKKLSKLVVAIAEIFRYRLLRPITSNATMLFVFNDEDRLDDISIDILKEGLRQSCIQETSLRKTKNMKGVGSVYSINNILAPALNIFPLRRWHQSIDADIFNSINFSAKTEKQYVTSLNKFVRIINKTTDDEESDTKQTKMKDFIGA